jgi:hypothetical protein
MQAAAALRTIGISSSHTLPYLAKASVDRVRSLTGGVRRM